jgi:DNA-binding NtrC family response regulator
MSSFERDPETRRGSDPDSEVRAIPSEAPTLLRKNYLAEPQQFGQMVGRSAAMRNLFSLLQRAAASEATVLIEGETGTGKEASAEAIHRESRRKHGPFVVVDCGAIPPQLLESELFGYERGAFTGAVTARQGAFEAASGGTILLDEIGELTLDLQPKILRAIERKQVKRIGSTAYVPADVRVLAATNRSLRTEVAEQRFRSDLYYRLAVVKIQLPPLRERIGDIPLLVENVLERLGIRDSPEAATLLSSDFVAKLAAYRWSGNIRQLRNYIERCVALGDTTLPPNDTIMPPPPPPPPVVAPLPVVSEAVAVFEGLNLPFKEARDSLVNAFERRYLEEQLARHGDNVSAAARASGIDRIHFYRLLWKHGLRAHDADKE